MFRKEGPDRSDRLNRVLAGYLAFTGGYVNAMGIVLLGAFTSHMTGNVSRAVSELALSDGSAALSAAGDVLAFFMGAVLASVILENNALRTLSRSYGVALAVEAGWLGIFGWLHAQRSLVTLQTLSLCLAMGVQNSLVTRLSGAVVRTTHLTGVITDLGIEAARWLRWWRSSASPGRGSGIGFGSAAGTRPSTSKVALLGTIAASFSLGGVSGGAAGVTAGGASVLLPLVMVSAGSLYALSSRPLERGGSIPPGSRV